MTPRKIELLAPAKNLECGLEAVRHGADAVYIGAPKFGARAAAGNTLSDLSALTGYAHRFGVRVYATINTIVRDDELDEAEQLIWDLYRIGIDAILVQDMGLTRLHLPPVPLHASTQTDNRTVEKVRFLQDAGFDRVVLARELSADAIRDIRRACPRIELEAFVHGALCVSYSGVCYASQYCFGRSANRGECAQFCRLPFDLVDGDGRVVVHQKHLLSLKDMNRLDHLEELLDAGVTSLKIEGRLKDASYVKNVVAAYRRRLDELMRRRPEYVRSSWGHENIAFDPQPQKSFNRGFTDYFLHGRAPHILSPDTPKFVGEPVGVLKSQQGRCLTVAGLVPLHNGDGLCYYDDGRQLRGFRLNKVEGNKAYVAGDVGRLPHKCRLYRNLDHEFESALSRPTADRKIRITWELAETAFGFRLTVQGEGGAEATVCHEYEKQPAARPQSAQATAILLKTGNTPFAAEEGGVRLPARDWFIPASVLTEWRRQALDLLQKDYALRYPRVLRRWQPTTHPYPQDALDYTGNVMNREAEAFYRAHGVTAVAPAFERQSPQGEVVVMTCRHCIKYAMGWCKKHGGAAPAYREPYRLVLGDGRSFRLVFDCAQCVMKVVAGPKSSA